MFCIPPPNSGVLYPSFNFSIENQYEIFLGFSGVLYTSVFMTHKNAIPRISLQQNLSKLNLHCYSIKIFDLTNQSYILTEQQWWDSHNILYQALKVYSEYMISFFIIQVLIYAYDTGYFYFYVQLSPVPATSNWGLQKTVIIGTMLLFKQCIRKGITSCQISVQIIFPSS